MPAVRRPTRQKINSWRCLFARGARVLCLGFSLAVLGESPPAHVPGPETVPWSFQPLRRPPVPQTRNARWPHHPVDAFILAGLEQAELPPAGAVDRATWLRRVSFTLTGLPPTEEATALYLNDFSPQADERAVDRFLASPHYGERWAQHWLDVVRYADTHGFEVNTERPHAWPYRDYVISAFNQDLPFPQFIREQLAGDALGRDPATGFLLTASVLLPGQIGQDDASKRLARQDALDEIVVNTTQTFLGLSIGCARCHDHKFDPISTRDYYSMQAFFAGVEYGDREWRTSDSAARRAEFERLDRSLRELDRQLERVEPLAQPGFTALPTNAVALALGVAATDTTAVPARRRKAVHPVKNIDRFRPIQAKAVRFTIFKTNQLEPCLDELEVYSVQGQNIALATTGTTAISSGDTVAANVHELRFIHDGRFGNSRSWMAASAGESWVQLEFPRATIVDRITWSRDREGTYRDRLPTEYRIEIEDTFGRWQCVADSSDRRSLPPNGALASDTHADAVDTFGLTESEATRARQLWEERQRTERQKAASAPRMVFAGTFRTPDAIHVLHRGDPEQPKEPCGPAIPQVLGSVAVDAAAEEQHRRRVLADWLAAPNNPLAARVMVNRVWQGHFGLGLVETANDFGRTGTKPSHPELLDWLAVELLESGGSIKHLHRLICLSSTYRQASRMNAKAAALDGDVRLLWRFPSRRLEAESIRDSMLAVSGRLNLTMGGRGFDLFNLRGGLSGFKPVESFSPEGRRRMIYAHKVRREREAVFGAFDCPDAGQSTGRRRESTTPIQALNLFNSRFTLDESAALAQRVTHRAGEAKPAQVEWAYRFTLGRAPTATELKEAVQVVEAHGLPTVCRALFNSNEFLFIP